MGIVSLDQLTKALVKGITIPFLGIEWAGMRYGQSITLIGDILRLTYIENPGMAFGINFGGKTFFALFSIIACIGIFWYLYTLRRERLRVKLPLALILGGALGNLIDRVFYGLFYREAPLFHGKVVDFIDVIFFNISVFGYNLSRWPVFNVADSAVTIGVVLMILFHRETLKDPKTAAPSGESIQSDLPAAPLPEVDTVSEKTDASRSPSID